MKEAKIKNIKKEILLILARTYDFSLVKKKFPNIKDDFIKKVLLEAADFFHEEEKKPLVSGAASKSLIIYTDGASKGNPGISGAGVAIKDAKGNDLAHFKKYLGVMTNNKAEYNALIIGLKNSIKLKCKKIKIFMDSELIVKQVKGEYKVKNPDLKILYNNTMKLLKKFEKYDINYIRRSDNKLADSLANKAISEHLSSERNR